MAFNFNNVYFSYFVISWTNFELVNYKDIQMTPSILSKPARTLSTSGLKSRVLKLSFLSLKMMVKSGLEFILKLTKPLQSCCCPVQKYLPRMAELAWQLSRYLWRGLVNFKINSRPIFTIIFKLKNDSFKTRDFSPLRGLSQFTFAYFGIFWPRTSLVCTFYVANYMFFWSPTHPKCKRNLWKAPKTFYPKHQNSYYSSR